MSTTSKKQLLTPTANQLPTAGLPACIYSRISRDRAGAGLGVDRQEADCRALAQRLGWNVVAVYVDNDISAYSGRVRPQYREMLTEIENGTIRGVLAWHSDRLHRRISELEGFVSVVEKHGVQVQTVTSGEVDLSTASGRMVARILGSVAQAEVEQTRARIQAQKRQAAVAGLYRGGPRPYGFEADGITHRADEAQVIQEATEAVLAGRTLAAVARELNERGITTSTGNVWTYMRVRDMLIRPRNGGLLGVGRADRGEVEIVGPGAWEPIVPPDTWRALYALLRDPSRRKQDGRDLRHLGSGLYRCGLCSGPMRTVPYGGTPARGGPRTYHYRCVTAPHMTVRKDKTDEFVLAVLAERIRDPRVVAAMQPADDRLQGDRDRRADLVTRLEMFESDYAAGTITGGQLQKVTTSVQAELAQIDDRLATGLRKIAASPVLNAVDPGQALLDAPVDVQQAIGKALIEVEILPSPKKGAAWTSQRVRITWRTA